MKVILGLCTAEQRAAAKAMNVQTEARTPRKGAKDAKGSRPAERSVQISLPLSPELVTALDAWIARQPDANELNRAAAARRLIEKSLAN